VLCIALGIGANAAADFCPKRTGRKERTQGIHVPAHAPELHGQLGFSRAATRLMSGFLYGISAADPISYLAALLVLGVVCSAAALLPARRATRIDPVIALRES
jgi:ABC-type antimicrobial peptide transport system permease subunit